MARHYVAHGWAKQISCSSLDLHAVRMPLGESGVRDPVSPSALGNKSSTTGRVLGGMGLGSVAPVKVALPVPSSPSAVEATVSVTTFRHAEIHTHTILPPPHTLDANYFVGVPSTSALPSGYTMGTPVRFGMHFPWASECTPTSYRSGGMAAPVPAAVTPVILSPASTTRAINLGNPLSTPVSTTRTIDLDSPAVAMTTPCTTEQGTQTTETADQGTQTDEDSEFMEVMEKWKPPATEVGTSEPLAAGSDDTSTQKLLLGVRDKLEEIRGMNRSTNMPFDEPIDEEPLDQMKNPFEETDKRNRLCWSTPLLLPHSFSERAGETRQHVQQRVVDFQARGDRVKPDHLPTDWWANGS